MPGHEEVSMADAEVPFWERKSLEEMSAVEWEALCDGCGLCCLHKLENEYDGSFHYTNLACQLLDQSTCRCGDYAHRRERVPDCASITSRTALEFRWLPGTCAYRRLAQGEPLPPWHYLVCGDREAVHRAGISRRGRMVCETAVAEDDWEDYIIFRSRG
jgi:hypothetical protein